MVGLVHLLFVGASATVVARQESNPLGQVIDLLNDLSAKVTKDGEAEASAYAEYSEWCKDTKKDKGFEIKTATTEQQELEAKIGELSGVIDAADSKIADLAAAISAGTAELTNATSFRETEASDFATGEKELVEVIDTLGRAIQILEREMQKNPAAFAQVASGGFTSVLQSLENVVDAASFSVTDKQRLLALVQSQQGADDEDGEFGAPAAAAYESHSSSIFDVLEDMKEKAEAQLSELRKAEMEASHNYNMLKQGLEDQLAADNKNMDEEKSVKSSSEEEKAASEGELKVTIEDLESTQEELESVTADCKQVAENHEATVASRAEELKVIAEAIDVLKSSTSGAVEQTYSFLQVSASSKSHSGIRTRADLARSEVVTVLKKLAKTHHSAALAQLASRIAAVVRFGSASGEDPFAKVKGLIEEMISKLQEEAGAEATEKAYCDEQMAETAAKKEELDTEIAKLTTKIDRDAAKSAELKETVKELQGELAAMAKQQAEMDKMRQETHADYVQAKADLEQGLSGVRKALVVLREYYAAGEGDAAFVQRGGSLSQQPAKPELHSESGGGATSIIGILEVVESDFATNLAKEETEEATAQDAYEKMTQENKVTKATKDQDVKYKTQEYTALDKTISALSSDRDTANTELSAVLDYQGKLNERCVAKPETYESRKQRREAEIAGLKEALKILETETALVQRAGKRRHSFRGALAAAS